MKYLSIDIETTGLSPVKDQVLMFSGIVEDTEALLPLDKLPHLTFILRHERIVGHAFALQMNAWILALMVDSEQQKYSVFDLDEALDHLQEFLRDNFGKGTITIAGKNVANFDWQFIKDWFDTIGFKVRHRMIDPGSVFFDSTKGYLPNLDDIKEICGIEGEVTHDAYDDALDVIKVLRTKY